MGGYKDCLENQCTTDHSREYVRACVQLPSNQHRETALELTNQAEVDQFRDWDSNNCRKRRKAQVTTIAVWQQSTEAQGNNYKIYKK